MNNLVVYVHGKGGSSAEAEHYKPLFPKSEVIGFDYRSQTPWEAKEEFTQFFAEKRRMYDTLTLIANSIGAYFSITSLSENLVDKAYLISPVVDMEKLICNMMHLAKVTEQKLEEKSEIPTEFGETLSWDYIFAMCVKALLNGVFRHAFCTAKTIISPQWKQYRILQRKQTQT